MEYVINCAFGGFQLPDEVINIPNFSELTSRETSNDIRTNPILINWVHKHPNSELGIVVIPDNATDFMVSVDDGFEEVYAVVNGKIIFLPPEVEDDT